MKRKTGTTTMKAAHFRECCKANSRTSQPKVKARSPQAVYGGPSPQLGKVGQLINGR